MLFTRLFLALILAFGPPLEASAQFARMFMNPRFALAYVGTTNGAWSPTTAGAQLPFNGSGSWTVTVNKQASMTLFTAAGGASGGNAGSLAGSGGGGGGGAYNSGGISVTLLPGKTYTLSIGGPNANTTVTNTTDAITISSLNTGTVGSTAVPGLGGTGGGVVTGAGTAGGNGGNGEGAGVSCTGGANNGANGTGNGGGGGGGSNDGGTGGGCGGTNGVSGPDGYTGGGGGPLGISICGTVVSGGGGGQGAGSTFGGAGFHAGVAAQAGIGCLQLVSIP